MNKLPTRENLQQQLNDMDTSTLLQDGLDSACIGFTYYGDHCLAVYDETRCIEALESQGMNREEAVEYYYFNVSGAYVGEQTPIFVTPVNHFGH